MLATAPYLVGALAFLLIVVVVDPYDLRSWGLPPKIADHRYPDTEWPLLIKGMTAGDYDTVLVGASTMMAVTPAEMRTAFGPASRPVNLAYPLAAPEDTRETLDFVRAMPRLKRVILVIDHSQMLPMGVRYTPARIRQSVFGSSWSHAGDFSMDTAEASFNRLAFGVYDRPAWSAMSRPSFLHEFSMLGDKRAMARIRRSVGRYHSIVLGSPTIEDCGRFPFLEQVLRPELQRLVDRGVEVELLFPPYPLAAYYDWIERRLQNDSFQRGPVFPQLIAFKRCVLQVTAAFGDKVSVTAVDNDLSLTANLDNFDDPVHLLRPAAYQAVLNHIATGDSRLTLQNLPLHEQQLGRNILAYRAP
jgi:hypothetical protein